MSPRQQPIKGVTHHVILAVWGRPSFVNLIHPRPSPWSYVPPCSVSYERQCTDTHLEQTHNKLMLPWKVTLMPQLSNFMSYWGCDSLIESLDLILWTKIDVANLKYYFLRHTVTNVENILNLFSGEMINFCFRKQRHAEKNKVCGDIHLL